MTRRMTRRSFVKRSAGVAAAATLAVGTPANVLGKNDEIQVAVIGFHGRGGTHIHEFSKIKGVRLAALCDVDETVLNRGVSDQAKKNNKVFGEKDYRKLVESKDIDVVTTATPNHQHSLVTILAVQAGKDVYVEKPVCHEVWEGRQMVNAARKYKRIVQAGTQSRSSIKGIGAAVEYVQSGKLGKTLYAVGTCFKPRGSIGKLSSPLVIPPTIDYDLWCGPAAKVDLYRPHLHYDWHWDFNTGNGDMGNQGIHQMDIARWFLGEMKIAPRTLSIGGRLGYDDAGNTPNTQTVLHDYPAAPLIFETRGLPKKDLNWKNGMDNWRGSGIGVVVQCEGGHVLVPNYYSAKAYDKSGKEVESWRENGDPMSAHVQNFIDCVRSRKHTDLHADIETGFISSALCHTGGISHRVGKVTPQGQIHEELKGHKDFDESFGRMCEHLKANHVNPDELTLGAWLEIDPKTEQLTNNLAAAKLMRRVDRKGFEVPDLSSFASAG
jgi:predicted dehydrogenase